MKKKSLILFAILLTVFTSLIADNIIPIRTDVSGYTSWTDTDVTGTTYLQLLKSTSSTITPVMNFDSYTSETLNFKARTYGGVIATENEVFVSISSDNGSSWTSLGSRIPTTTTSTAMTSFDLSSYNGTEIIVKFSVAGTNNSIGAGIDDITISGNLAGVPSAPNIAPFSGLMAPPLEDANLDLTANVTDPDNDLAIVEIGYKINNEVNPHFINMTETTSSNFAGALPASLYNNGDLVEYWISAMDSATPVHVSESAHYKFLAGTTPVSTIRQNDANGISNYNGVLCRVTGVAYNNDGIFSAATANDCYLLDNTGGIDAYKNPVLTSFSFVENHSYTVTGNVTNYNGKLEVVMTSAIDNGVVSFPAYTVVTLSQLLATPESYEGKYIAIQNISRTGATAWPTTSTNTTLSMTDGANQTSLYLPKLTDCFTNPEPVWPKDVKGIFTQYDNSSPYTEGYQLVIKGYSEIQNSGTLPVTFSSFTASLSASNTVSLEWTTQSESNLRGFYIYRSTTNNTVNADRITSLIQPSNTSNEANYTYNDAEVSVNNTYYYWIVANELNSNNEWYGPCSVNVTGNTTPQLPTETALNNVYPNPLNINKAEASFSCKVRENETANLSIFNVKGQTVKEYTLSSGNHSFKWDGKDLNGKKCSTGVYFYKLSSPTMTSVRKMMIVK